MTRSVDEQRIEEFRTCLKDRNMNRQTIELYASNIKKLSEYLGGRELTQSDLEAYKSWLIHEKKYKINSANTYIACVRLFIQAMGWKDMNIQVYSLAGEKKNLDDKYISRTDYQRLVTTAMYLEDYRMAMLIQVLCHINIRFSELYALDREALDRGYIEVVRQKHIDRIEIPEYLSDSLKIYAERQGITSGVIFRANGQKIPNRSGVWRNVKKLCEKAEIEEGRVTLQKLKKPNVRDYYPFYPMVEEKGG